MATSLTDDELQKLYAWVDTIPLSRPKRNINRDFSDGVLAAEIVGYYFPRLVDLHNYSAANGTQQKMYNWHTFNTKVLVKIKHQLPPPMIEDIIHCKPGAVEVFLHNLQYKLAKYKAGREKARSSSSFAAGQESIHPSARGSFIGDEETYASSASPPPSSRLGGGGSFSSGISSPPSRRATISQQQQPQQQQTLGLGSTTTCSSSHRAGIPSTTIDSFSARNAGSPAIPRGSSVSEYNNKLKKTGGAAGSSGRGGAHVPGPTKASRAELQREVDEEILLEKEETIQELRETVEILEMKMSKLEQLLRLKDGKIQRLADELARLTFGASS